MKNKYIQLIRYIVLVGTLFYLQTSHGAQYESTLQWANRASLSLPVNSIVSEVIVKPGQHVKKGAVMLLLDQRQFKAKLSAAQAMVTRYKPGRDEAKKELARQLELFERTVTSQVELDTAKIDFAEKNALYNNAQALYQQAKIDLEYTELKAPYDLIVIRPRVSVGQTVVNLDLAVPLLDIADAGVWMASIIVKPEDMQVLDVGKQVQVAAGKQTLSGTVSMLDAIDDGKGNVRYRVEVNVKADQNDGLWLGKKVTISWQ
ncbi:MAG: efflux RND transporter periplasmic adaptor subunit [Gammaproteobacteria bacterium]|nr:MAG: efflux RND transporter periplasmic adaptor subunit [Gammaproteobacteria bacterium]